MSLLTHPSLRGLMACCIALVLIAGCSTSRPATDAQPADATAEQTPSDDTQPMVEADPAASNAMMDDATDTVLDTVEAGIFDNGRMWTFEYPPKEYLAETYDFRPSDEWFAQARLGALRIPGCTASFVSPNGLVMTNHHCGRGTVAGISGEEEDLLSNGFAARTMEEERPAPSMYADQLIAIEDVTDEVYAAIEAAETDAERAQSQQTAIQDIQARVKQEAAAEGDSIVVQVISLYQGGRYSAYTFKRYTDMRLVMAPELAMGHFGGDPDNFTFPRYSLDMTFFRAYDADGTPLETPNYFGWSEDGSEPGEMVFVVGNPGSTNRLETVAQLQFRRDVQEKVILDYIEKRLAALRQEYEENPSSGLRSQILGLSNAEKLYTGRVKGLNDPIVMAKRADAQEDFMAAVRSDSTLNAEYGDLIEEIEQIQAQKREYAAEFGAFLGLQPQSGLASATLRRAILAYTYLQQQEAGAGEQALAGLQEQLLGISDLPEAREERFLMARLQELQDYMGDDERLMATMQGRTPDEMADDLIANSALSDAETTAQALEEGTLTMDDPALQMADVFMERRAAFQSAFAGLGAQERELNRQRGRAQFDVYGTTVPPDATFSLRLADGVVQGYDYNGTVAPPYTTIYGLYDHYYSYQETDMAYEWELPESWLDAPETLDLSTPMNLVATPDIIGGNSGSPLLNEELEVVGLVFDGNIESLPSAFIFQTERSRTVAVDSRGMLEALDEVYDLDRLVMELTTGQLMETEAAADEAMASQP